MGPNELRYPSENSPAPQANEGQRRSHLLFSNWSSGTLCRRSSLYAGAVVPPRRLELPKNFMMLGDFFCELSTADE